MDQLEVLIHGSAEARRLSGEWAAEAPGSVRSAKKGQW